MLFCWINSKNTDVKVVFFTVVCWCALDCRHWKNFWGGWKGLCIDPNKGQTQFTLTHSGTNQPQGCWLSMLPIIHLETRRFVWHRASMDALNITVWTQTCRMFNVVFKQSEQWWGLLQAVYFTSLNIWTLLWMPCFTPRTCFDSPRGRFIPTATVLTSVFHGKLKKHIFSFRRPQVSFLSRKRWSKCLDPSAKKKQK